MNTATATQRIQTTCALSLALLVSGTTTAAHMFDHADSELYRHEHPAPETPSCGHSHGPQVITFGHGFRQTSQPCDAANTSVTIMPPVRLARPLSGSQYMRSSDGIRYSF